jgi:hypothetical protein
VFRHRKSRRHGARGQIAAPERDDLVADEEGQAERIVRNRLLRGLRHAIEHLADVERPAQRAEQIVEHLQVGGAFLERFRAARLFGDVVVRKREADVIGDALRHSDVGRRVA